jgi:substrate import-associated zinc metallohydrolase lipoprotein
MKKINIILFATTFMLLASCKKTEKLDREIVGLGGDTWTQTALDVWLYNNFTKPYNLSVKYRWDGTEYDNSKTLVPPNLEKVQPLMELVKSAWIDAYTGEVSQNFIKIYAPKNYILVGSVAYNSNGSYTLGEAEGGTRVTLYNVNNFTTEDRAVSKRILKTIHHEFGHILHQNIMYPVEFSTITPSGYTADWSSTSGSDYANKGFITQYAQASPNEDFVEMIAIMLTEGKLAYEALLASNTNATSVAAIRAKEAIVAAYMSSVWGINIYTLQNRVQAGLNAKSPDKPTTYLGLGKTYTQVAVTPDATPGMSADFMAAYDAAKIALNGYGGRAINNFSLVYTTAGQVILRVNYSFSGTNYTANFTYNVATNTAGNITLTLASTDAFAAAIASYVAPLTNYLTQSQFTYKFFYSADYKNMYVGLAKTNNSGSYFYGTMGN